MCIMNFNNVIQVGDSTVLTFHLEQCLCKLSALDISSSIHKIIIHNCNEMEKFPLEELQLLQKLSKHDLILKEKSFSGTHLFHLLLVLLTKGVARRKSEQVWFLNVVVTFFHDKLGVLHLHQKFKDRVILLAYGLFVQHNLKRPFTIVIDLHNL